jgi:hypothetical protein
MQHKLLLLECVILATISQSQAVADFVMKSGLGLKEVAWG